MWAECESGASTTGADAPLRKSETPDVKVFSYGAASRNLAGVLEAAQQDGAAVIRNRDGESFVVRPESAHKSVLDVEGIDLGVTADEIVAAVREGRERDY